MSERNLLITILDTNPVWWGMQSAGLILPSESANAKKSRLLQDNVKHIHFDKKTERDFKIMFD
jgi:hypothetical protein